MRQIHIPETPRLWFPVQQIRQHPRCPASSDIPVYFEGSFNPVGNCDPRNTVHSCFPHSRNRTRNVHVNPQITTRVNTRKHQIRLRTNVMKSNTHAIGRCSPYSILKFRSAIDMNRTVSSHLMPAARQLPLRSYHNCFAIYSLQKCLNPWSVDAVVVG